MITRRFLVPLYVPRREISCDPPASRHAPVKKAALIIEGTPNTSRPTRFPYVQLRSSSTSSSTSTSRSTGNLATTWPTHRSQDRRRAVKSRSSGKKKPKFPVGRINGPSSHAGVVSITCQLMGRRRRRRRRRGGERELSPQKLEPIPSVLSLVRPGRVVDMHLFTCHPCDEIRRWKSTEISLWPGM
jgi:hypothetical protein